MLTAENIKAMLEGKYSDISVEVFDTIGSTNSYAKGQKELRFGIIAAREQTAGRGRQGHSFYSPRGTGLYMTVVLPITPMEAYEFSLTSAAAVACARAVESVCGISPQIKWVNDLYISGKKVAGILTEADTDRVIVGIGINVTTTDFPALLPMAGSLGTEGISLSELAACITNELCGIAFSRSRDFMAEYKSRSMLIGRPITYRQNGSLVRAQAVDIDDSGRLIVDTDGCRQALSSGEIDIVL